jgi:hypothetical protein
MTGAAVPGVDYDPEGSSGSISVLAPGDTRIVVQTLDSNSAQPVTLTLHISIGSHSGGDFQIGTGDATTTIEPTSETPAATVAQVKFSGNGLTPFPGRSAVE